MIDSSFAGRVGRGIRAALLWLIGGYRRWISPLLPARCRFYPSCSEYAAQALSTHGLQHGGWLACCRLGKCHPFHPGGFDPVPTERASPAPTAPEQI